MGEDNIELSERDHSDIVWPDSKVTISRKRSPVEMAANDEEVKVGWQWFLLLQWRCPAQLEVFGGKKGYVPSLIP